MREGQSQVQSFQTFHDEELAAKQMQKEVGAYSYVNSFQDDL